MHVLVFKKKNLFADPTEQEIFLFIFFCDIYGQLAVDFFFLKNSEIILAYYHLQLLHFKNNYATENEKKKKKKNI